MIADTKYVLNGVIWELVDGQGKVIFRSGDFDEFFAFCSEHFNEYSYRCDVRWESEDAGLAIGRNRMDHWVWNHEGLSSAV